MRELEVGSEIDRYVVEGVLGQGGMAWVYRVRHRDLGSVHVLKVLVIQVDGVQERLRLEGKAQARLRHPNIVTVTDLLEVDGAPGLIMECVEGPDLSRLIGALQGKTDLIDALVRGIIAGVGAAHRQGMVHRDLKPANILVATQAGHPFPKIADFGLVKFLMDDQEGTQLTVTGAKMGTPAYMAPEQIHDPRIVDARSDIFSLGVILYELCCGVRPFLGGDILSIFQAITRGDYVAPRKIDPDLPERMDRAIRAALVVDPAERVPSCEQLLELWEGRREDWAASQPLDGKDGAPSWSAVVQAAPGPQAEGYQPTATGGPQGFEQPSADQTFDVESLPADDEPSDVDAPVSRGTLAPPTSEVPPAPGRGPWVWLALAGLLVLGTIAGPLLLKDGSGGEAAPAAELDVESPPEAPTALPAAASAPLAPPDDAQRAPAAEPAPSPRPEPPTERAQPRPGAQPGAATQPPSVVQPVAQAPAEPAPGEASAPPTMATVGSDGAVKIWLVGAEGNFPPGELPPGAYTIKAFFEPTRAIEAGTLEVQAGDRLFVRCSATLFTCSVGEP